MPAWPAYAHLLLAGYGESRAPSLLRTEMEDGPPKQARIRSRALVTRKAVVQLRSLADYAGAPLILNFWASYCAPCRLEMAQFNRLLEQYRPQSLRVLAVNHGEMPARVLQFLQTVPFHGEALLDRSQTQLPAWGGIALPTSFVLDAQGQVRLWHVGEIDWLGPRAQAQLAAVLRG